MEHFPLTNVLFFTILLKYGTFSLTYVLFVNILVKYGTFSLAGVLFVNILLKHGTAFPDGCTVRYHLTEVWNIFP
jgi:hypothetical protein